MPWPGLEPWTYWLQKQSSTTALRGPCQLLEILDHLLIAAYYKQQNPAFLHCYQLYKKIALQMFKKNLKSTFSKIQSLDSVFLDEQRSDDKSSHNPMFVVLLYCCVVVVVYTAKIYSHTTSLLRLKSCKFGLPTSQSSILLLAVLIYIWTTTSLRLSAVKNGFLR